MKIMYIGHHDEVRVPLPMGGEVTVQKNKAIILPDSLGKRLLDQTGNWKKKGAKK